MADQNVKISGHTQEFEASLIEAGVHKDADAGNSIGLATQADRDTCWADLERRVSENVAARAATVG